MKRLRKAVFPVAGLGTRILPATKAMPKEMLTVVDRPLIQYAVEEALDAGIEHFIFVTARGKSSLEDHFDRAYELEATLASRGKSDACLTQTRFTPGAISYVRQQVPLGLGHAVWCARELIGDEPFAVLLPDDLMIGAPGCLRQMVEAYEEVGGNLLCTERVSESDTSRYGIIAPGDSSGGITDVLGLVEKPAPGTAPSDMAVIGRYILQPEIMSLLAEIGTGAGGEIQLTDAIACLAQRGEVGAIEFSGERHDCGTSSGFVVANLALGLGKPEIAKSISLFLGREPAHPAFAT
jgi:UTP--glucose-1-phosphate uridylyltransferase